MALSIALALGITGCPPAPAVDEERLARRVAELLAERYGEEGLCANRPGSSGGEDGDEPASSESSASASRDPTGDARAAAIRAMADSMIAQGANANGDPDSAPLAMIPVELTADQRATSTGDEAHRRWCLPSSALPAIGPERAPVSIVAFLDPECPFCARLLPSLLRAQRAFSPHVRLSFALYPLNFHSGAERASEALVEAYSQRQSDGFVAMLRRLYADRHELSTDALVAEASELGMDGARVRDALRDRRHARAVASSFALGQSAGVNATPVFFINGRKISGAVSDETLGGLLDEELTRGRRIARSAARDATALCRADSSTTAATPQRTLPLPPNGDAP
jgi:protein-disulfide isomerase